MGLIPERGRYLVQKPAKHTIYILSGVHTDYDHVGMILRNHFNKTWFGAANFIGRLDQEKRVPVGTYSQDVAETKLRDIWQGGHGSQPGLEFEVQPPLKPRPRPVFG